MFATNYFLKIYDSAKVDRRMGVFNTTNILPNGESITTS